MNILTDEYFMNEAIKQAQQAFDEDEVPVGAVVVCNNQVIAKGYNQTERLNDVTAHAEMIAITAAANYLNSKYLKDCTLYVTLEPCVMCAGATGWAQMSKIIYGAGDEKQGFISKARNALHPKTILVGRILEDRCSQLLTSFFEKKREL